MLAPNIALLVLQRRVDILEEILIQHIHHVGELGGHEKQLIELEALRTPSPVFDYAGAPQLNLKSKG